MNYQAALVLVRKATDMLDGFVSEGRRGGSMSSLTLLETFERLLRRIEGQAVGVSLVLFSSTDID